jgi:hypothetical protein
MTSASLWAAITSVTRGVWAGSARTGLGRSFASAATIAG